MEIEYKWEPVSEQSAFELEDVLEKPLVAEALGDSERIHMHGIYYDTPDGTLAEKRIGLRLRGENSAFVCCMKVPAPAQEGGAKTRREYEVEATEIMAGVEALRSVGAPEDVCDEVAAKGLAVTCETEFDRMACQVRLDGCEAELALDSGCLRREGREVPLAEVELEYKSGDIDAFHAYAAKLQEELGLREQPLSKLARALQV